jgi:hypothetical protein
MARKPIKRRKMSVKLTEDTAVEVVTMELRLGKTLSDNIQRIVASKFTNSKKDERAFEQFWVEMICAALQAEVQDYAAKIKFSGNTRVTSNAVH